MNTPADFGLAETSFAYDGKIVLEDENGDLYVEVAPADFRSVPSGSELTDR